VTGNILAVQGKPSTAEYVDKFAELVFTLTASTDKSAPMLLVTDGTNGIALFPSTTPVPVTIKVDGAALTVGDKITLIEATDMVDIPAGLKSTTVSADGGWEFTLDYTPSGKTLTAEVTGVPDPTPDPTPAPYHSDSSSPTMGELGLLLSGLALAGVAAPALRRRERKARKQG
ncbi:MAG: hypothetical protein J6T92_08440, partial [Ottowia sp.]|nr:hypothetical protein [Ottowia sp.]